MNAERCAGAKWGRWGRRGHPILSDEGASSPAAPGRHDQGSGERGFTLIELLIVCMIIPLIIGALSAGLITILNLQSSVKSRITDTSDAQVVSSTFLKDVQSATKMTTLRSSSYQCGNSSYTQLLGLQWDVVVVGGVPVPQTVVSYDSVPVTVGTATTYSLVREYCTSGNTSTPASSTTAALDISGSQYPPCMTGATCTPDGTTQGWTAATSVPAVKFVVDETGSGFVYTLLADSRSWTPVVAASIPVGPAFSPLTVLSTGSTGLSLGNYSSITVNKSPGTNGSSVAIASPSAGSVSFGTSASLTASTLNTTDPLLNSVSPGAESSPPTEYFSPQVSDPLSGIFTAPTSPGNVVTCTKAGSSYTCPHGMYTSDPGFASGSTVTFTGGPPTEFTKTFVIPPNVTMTFDFGTYIFDGSQAISPPASGNASITGLNVLFYVPNGSVDFGNGTSVYLAPINGDYGVTIWDATTTSTTAVNIESVQSDLNSYGGIYIPGGTVNATLSNAAANSALSVMFLIASDVNLAPYTSVIVTGP